MTFSCRNDCCLVYFFLSYLIIS